MLGYSAGQTSSSKIPCVEIEPWQLMTVPSTRIKSPSSGMPSWEEAEAESIVVAQISATTIRTHPLVVLRGCRCPTTTTLCMASTRLYPRARYTTTNMTVTVTSKTTGEPRHPGAARNAISKHRTPRRSPLPASVRAVTTSPGRIQINGKSETHPGSKTTVTTATKPRGPVDQLVLGTATTAVIQASPHPAPAQSFRRQT